MQGRHLTGFVHHRVARSETWRRFPQRDLNRVIPRADAHADAQWLLPRVHPRLVAELNSLAVQAAATDQIGEILKNVSAGHDVDGAGFRERLASVLSFDPGELVITRAKDGDSF